MLEPLFTPQAEFELDVGGLNFTISDSLLLHKLLATWQGEHVASRRGELGEEEHNMGGVSKSRRKRQSEASASASAEASAYNEAFAYINVSASAKDSASAFVKNFYVQVMNDVKVKHDSGELSPDQKATAKTWIQETQDLLGVKSFEVLGLEVGNKSSVEIKEWKESGNMTYDQESAMQDLGIDTQVKKT